MSWEDTFTSWAKPLGETEQSKCENTEKMIRNAVSEDPVLSKMNVGVILQGSYRMNTNIRQESDVDVCVYLKDTFFYDLHTHGLQGSPVTYGIYPASIEYKDFKNYVENALVNKFGRKGVARGNKAFDIRENSYRVDADVLPAFEHRRYRGLYGSTPIYDNGIEFMTDNGVRVINWPEQNHLNAVNKNDLTSRRYKRAVRIIKRLRNKMQEDGVAEAKNISSFLISCLVWNTPNEHFTSSLYQDNIRNVLAHTYNNTMTDEQSKQWGEVNEFKYLFNPMQGWTREQTHAFLSSAWDYLGFK